MYIWYQAIEMAAKGTPMCNEKSNDYMALNYNELVWFRKDNDQIESKVVIHAHEHWIDNWIPYVKKVKLTEDEKVILRNLPEEYKWIARDSDEKVWIYDTKPQKSNQCFKVLLDYEIDPYELIFNNLFPQIKWEAAEPTLIADLLKE